MGEISNASLKVPLPKPQSFPATAPLPRSELILISLATALVAVRGSPETPKANGLATDLASHGANEGDGEAWGWPQPLSSSHTL